MAENGGDDQKRTSGAIWNRLDQQGESIGDLARAQAATEANLAALAASVESGFNSINNSLSRIVDRDSRPTNWLGVGSLLFVVIGSLITFVALQTDPVRVRAMENATTLDKALERELVNAEYRGATNARLDALEDEIKKVDEYGSRRWIQQAPRKDD